MLTLSHTNEQSEGKTDHASSSVQLQHETYEQGLQVPMAKPRVALHRPPPTLEIKYTLAGRRCGQREVCLQEGGLNNSSCLSTNDWEVTSPGNTSVVLRSEEAQPGMPGHCSTQTSSNARMQGHINDQLSEDLLGKAWARHNPVCTVQEEKYAIWGSPSATARAGSGRESVAAAGGRSSLAGCTEPASSCLAVVLAQTAVSLLLQKKGGELDESICW